MKHDPLQMTKRRLERLKQKTYRSAAPYIFGQRYHWVFGFTKEGKKVIWGPYYDPREAERDLTSLDDGEVFSLDTRDITRATREIKAELLKRGEDPDEALKRVLHQKEIFLGKAEKKRDR